MRVPQYCTTSLEEGLISASSTVLLARAQTGLLGEEKAKVNPDLALDRGHPRSSVRSSGGRPTLCVYSTN